MRKLRASGKRNVPALILLALVGACNSEPIAAPAVLEKTVVDTAWVTGAAREAVLPSGLLQLAVIADAVLPEIDEARARALANAWLLDIAPQLASAFSRDHQSRVHAQSMSLCGRVYYANSAHTPVELNAPLSAIRALGPSWLVPMCQDGRPVVTLSVAANATDMRIVDGHLRFPKYHGNEFFAFGFPSSAGDLPVTPERAIEIAYQTTGKRVAAAPQLIRGPFGDPAQYAYWRMQLEAPATLYLVGGVTVAKQEIFVGRRDAWTPLGAFIANAPEAGRFDSIRYSRPKDFGSDPNQYGTLHLIPKVGAPVEVHAIVPPPSWR
jgi:hypothetical protein